MTTDTIERIAQSIDSLPKLPDTSIRLLRVINDPDSSFREIVDTIRFDQTITTELLKLCNSAYSGLTRKVTSIEEAARYLGTSTLMRLVLAAHSQTLLVPEQTGYGLRPGALWTHSVGVALGCQRIAARLKLDDDGLLFTAGLLHDMGKVLLNEYVGTDYLQITRLVSSARISFIEAERRIIGITHAEVGAMAAEQWKLPEPIVRCIRFHHAPSALDRPDPLVDAVHLADATCLLMGVGGGDDGQMYRVDARVLERSGFTDRDFETLGAELVSELKPIERLFAA